MIDLLKTGSTYLPLKLTRNPLWVHADAPDITILPERSGILLKCEVLVPTSEGSATFEVVGHRIGSERPVSLLAALEYYYGQDFDIASIIDGLLSFRMPKASGLTPFIASTQIIPFKTRTFTLDESGIEIQNSSTLSPIQYALRGGIQADSFAGWGEMFFSKYLQDNPKFLTWQTDEKSTFRNQPEFLTYLLNSIPKPTCLQIRCQVHFRNDFSREIFSVPNLKVNNPENYSNYVFPVSFESLGLASREVESTGKIVDYYYVWLADENNLRLSDTRKYILTRQFMPYVRYILFENSLGGIDTLTFTGELQNKVKTTTQIGERQLESTYLPSSAELFVSGKTAVREMTISTGWVDEMGTDYLQELMLSENVFFVTQDGFIPVILRDEEFQNHIDNEQLPGRQFIFELAKKERSYSALPIAQTVATRLTKWVPLNPYCIYNSESGMATGYQAAANLELRWVDTNEKVKGIAPKKNIAGTDGYVDPAFSDACSIGTASYKNAEVSRVGTFRRNNCTIGYGDFALVIVTANTFGGQSQIEANERAEARWTILNTQAYANLNGVCVPSPEYYTMTPPPASGYFNFRYQGNPTDSPIYFHGGPGANNNDQSSLVYGNHWALQQNTNPASVIYATAKNDCALPCTIASPNYTITCYGYNQNRRLRLWINGTVLAVDFVITPTQFQENGGAFLYRIPTSIVIPSQAFVFCLIENV